MGGRRGGVGGCPRDERPAACTPRRRCRRLGSRPKGREGNTSELSSESPSRAAQPRRPAVRGSRGCDAGQIGIDDARAAAAAAAARQLLEGRGAPLERRRRGRPGLRPGPGPGPRVTPAGEPGRPGPRATWCRPSYGSAHPGLPLTRIPGPRSPVTTPGRRGPRAPGRTKDHRPAGLTEGPGPGRGARAREPEVCSPRNSLPHGGRGGFARSSPPARPDCGLLSSELFPGRIPADDPTGGPRLSLAARRRRAARGPVRDGGRGPACGETAEVPRGPRGPRGSRTGPRVNRTGRFATAAAARRGS